MHPIRVTLALLTLVLLSITALTLAAIAQQPNPLNLSGRWNFSPTTTETNPRKLEDQKRGQSQEKEAQMHRAQTQMKPPEVRVTPAPKLSPLEAFRRAFGKPIAPGTVPPITKIKPTPSGFPRNETIPSPAYIPHQAEHQIQEHTRNTPADKRAIIFVPQPLPGGSNLSGTLIPWFAKCERRIRAAGFDERVFAHQSLSCLIHFTGADKAEVSILKSSGQPPIDRAALDVISDASPFPLTSRKADLKVDFSYPILEVMLLSGRLAPRQPISTY